MGKGETKEMVGITWRDGEDLWKSERGFQGKLLPVLTTRAVTCTDSLFALIFHIIQGLCV